MHQIIYYLFYIINIINNIIKIHVGNDYYGNYRLH